MEKDAITDFYQPMQHAKDINSVNPYHFNKRTNLLTNSNYFRYLQSGMSNHLIATHTRTHTMKNAFKKTINIFGSFSQSAKSCTEPPPLILK